MAQCVRAAPQTLFVLQEGKLFVHQFHEKSADFDLAFAFSSCCGKFRKLQTAPVLTGTKSQFAGVLSSAQCCNAREKAEKMVY